MAGRILDFWINDDGECELIYWDSLHGADVVVTIAPETPCEVQVGSTGVEPVTIREGFETIRRVMAGEPTP